MLKEQAKLFAQLSIAADAILILAAFALAYTIRDLFQPPLFTFGNYIWTMLLILPVWLYLLARQQLFASLRRFSCSDILSRVAAVHVWGAFAVAAVIFFLDRQIFSRSLFLLFILLSFLLLALEKSLLRLFLGSLRRRGFNYRQILIVGTQEKAHRFHRILEEHGDWGLRIVGFVETADPTFATHVDNHRVLGHISQLIEICKRQPVDEVVFCLPKDFVDEAERYVRGLEELGITVRMVLNFQKERSRCEISLFHDEFPILTFHGKNMDAQQLFLKRVIDIAGSLVGLIFTGLLFPVIALLIKYDSPGPVIFGQKRVGEGGRIFRCWKFRTMKVNSARRKRELLQQNEMVGAIFKIRKDPRVTRVGRFLRHTSLDELPQFWNVFRGEMSLVGTRPPTPAEVKQYENWHRRRISIKPGITGMWQVSGRSEIRQFDDIVRLDLNYIDCWSFWLDMQILLKTVAIVFARRGSY
jgi:exopolysaccharide biosynthesis polyprenyl glycosylphosphotransferase